MKTKIQLEEYYIGLDIGGTKCSVVLGDKNFNIYEKIVIGSIYTRNEKLFKSHIEKILKREAIPAANKVCKILPAALGDKIGDYAALCVALNQ